MSILKSASIWFHTTDQDKDYDTALVVTVRNSADAPVARLVDSGNHAFDDDSTHRFDMSVVGEHVFGHDLVSTTREEMLDGTITIQIGPRGSVIRSPFNGALWGELGGNDEWHFDFTIAFEFDDGSIVGDVRGVNLSERHREQKWQMRDLQFAYSKGFFSLGGEIKGAPAVLKPTGATVDIYVQGMDDRLWQRWWTGSEWSDWRMHDDGDFRLGSAPAVVSNGADRRNVFVRGVDGALYQKYWDRGTWSGWIGLGGEIKDAPAAVVPSGTIEDVYVRGMDDRLWQRWWTGSEWSNWLRHDDGDFRLGSAPAVVSNGADHRDVFCRGSDGALYHKFWDGRSWSSWFGLGGETEDAPAVVMPTRTSQDIYVRGKDDRLWQRWWTGSEWSDWRMHDDEDFRLGSAPAVVSDGADFRDVYVRGIDGALYHKYWDGRTWHP